MEPQTSIPLFPAVVSVTPPPPQRTFNRMLRVFLARTEPSSKDAKPTCWKKVIVLCVCACRVIYDGG
jgi:hypothetical protein